MNFFLRVSRILIKMNKQPVKKLFSLNPAFIQGIKEKRGGCPFFRIRAKGA